MSYGQMVVAQNAPAPLSRGVSGISGPKPRAALWRFGHIAPESFGLQRVGDLTGFENPSTGIYEVPTYPQLASVSSQARWIPLTDVNGGPAAESDLRALADKAVREVGRLQEYFENEMKGILFKKTPAERAQWYADHVQNFNSLLDEFGDPRFELAAVLAAAKPYPKLAAEVAPRVKDIVEKMNVIRLTLVDYANEAQAQAQLAARLEDYWRGYREIAEKLAEIGRRGLEALEASANLLGKIPKTVQDFKSWGVVAAIGGIVLLLFSAKGR